MPQSLRIFGAPPRIWSINALEDERSVSLEIGVRRWLLANPCAWIEEADAKATLDISDFQGFILRGYRMRSNGHGPAGGTMLRGPTVFSNSCG
jgi:hypothetical protein